MNNRPKRRLIWVPIIHTQADMGSLGEWVEYVYKRKIGHEKWKQHRKATEELWQRIRREIDNLHLDHERVRLYQDGLPDCGVEEKIVRDLAKGGSENYRLLAELMDKGAKVTGTESPELLVEEYDTIRQALAAEVSQGRNDAAASSKQRSKDLLDERNRFIAQRINDTLAAEETGLVFLGMLHSLKGLLAPDIQMIVLGQARPEATPRKADIDIKWSDEKKTEPDEQV